MRIDLHTHTNHSDGSLTPAELLAYARECEVDVLAITDHDTVAAYGELASHDQTLPRVLTGIEFSTAWLGRSVHIVGLNIATDDTTLQAGIQAQQQARHARAVTIAQRLERLGIANPLDDVLERSRGCPGRPHFAAHLVDIGFVKDQKTAFKRYLGAGKLGDVKESWAGMDEVIAWIRGAGGTAVLAHPAKYKLTRTKLFELVESFKTSGGQAVEVCSGAQDPATTSALARVINEAELLASCGSDFHHRTQSWSRPGQFAPMPGNVNPVWDAWQI